MISFVQIEYIIALVEEKNFQRAAEKCFVTQPTLSIQIKKAEELLGGKLFDRNAVPVQPTPFLNTILPQLLTIKQELDILTEQVNNDGVPKKELLTIGIIPTVAHYLIPAIFSVLQKKLPQFEIQFEELKTEKLLEKLSLRNIDLAILSEPFEFQQFHVQKLYLEEIYFYFQKKTQLKSIKDLQGYQPWLLSEGNCLRTQMVNFCDINQDDCNKWHYQGGNIDVLIRMVDLYGGYTLLPSHYPQENLDKNKIIQIADTKPMRSIVACYNRRNSKEQAFMKLFHIIQGMYQLEIKDNNWTLLS